MKIVLFHIRLCMCVYAFLSICVSLCVYDHFPISLVISTCVDLDPHIYIWISCVIQNTEKESNAYQWIWWWYEMLNSPLKTCLERWCQVFTPVTWVSPQNMNDKCLYRFFSKFYWYLEIWIFGIESKIKRHN